MARNQRVLKYIILLIFVVQHYICKQQLPLSSQKQTKQTLQQEGQQRQDQFNSKNDLLRLETSVQKKNLKQGATLINQTQCVNNTLGLIYNCPSTKICTSNYAFCPYASQNCSSSKPFLCGNNNICVLQPSTDCCGNQSFWCPHTNQCVSSQQSCCSLNTSTPIYCQATKTCVAHNYDCCSNYKSYITSNSTLVKCSNENKCVVKNTADYCFIPFNNSCVGQFSFQCPYDGKCVRNITECASPRVCPPGYTTCPDYTCIPGLAQYPACSSLATCLNQTSLAYGRCSDGITCTDDLDICPSQVTCQNGFVVCPDNSCVQNQFQCLQPPIFNPTKMGSCGPQSIRSQNGKCNGSFNTQQFQNCSSLQMFQCPSTFQCVTSNEMCPTNVYCPLVTNYTYSFKTIICDDGPQICTWDTTRCHKSSCQSSINYFSVPNVAVPWPAYSPNTLITCLDGRCNLYGCMTPISCSSNYPIKSQIIGYICHAKTSDADVTAEIYYRIQALSCPQNLVTCLSGHCRPTIEDCPQYITCPKQLPIQCQDGSCVNNTNNCLIADIITSTALKNCSSQGLILCQSDLKTCSNSVEQCPTMSTCPFGYTKCSENQCALDWECPQNQAICTSLNPIYCRSKNTCVANITICPSLTVCPVSFPVKCATDQSCQKSVQFCPAISSNYTIVPFQVQTVQTSSPVCLSPPFYICQNGSCNFNCPEWNVCPQSNQIQCPNGKCVSNITLCSNSSNGCPFNLPKFCQYSAQCVKNLSQCTNQTIALLTLNQICQTRFGKNFTGCPLGNCVNITSVSQTVACQNFQNYSGGCANYQYPNDIQSPKACFVFQCPQQVPYKCPNGLCVSQQKYCPVAPFTANQINNCINQSNLTGLDLRIPCGDNMCVSSSDQCTPLYNCSYNQNNLLYRCNDGTCKSSFDQCPQMNSTFCTYRCSNGQCVDNPTYCLTEQGCTQLYPYRCEYNGICMKNLSSCYATSDIIQRMAIQYNQPVTNNFCASKGLTSCISDYLMYCSINSTKCISLETGCPVNTPILCGNFCVKSILACNNHVAITQLNNQGCPINNPFRCSNLDINQCAALPYTFDSNLYANTCSTQIQNILGLYFINKCSSPLTPISCANGTCVQSIGQCQSCSFFCYQMMACVSSINDCQMYQNLTKNNQTLQYLQQCPYGTPIRCAINGLCVSDTIQCLGQFSSAFNQIYTGQLLDSNCPINSPIRCINGTCVSTYQQCLSLVSINTFQLVNPISWNASQSNKNLSCQVYCADGSCRDRQQNCPLPQSCLNPMKPYRCLNGFCAQDQNTCVQLFGVSENDSRDGYSAFCIGMLSPNTNLNFVRCEDGTCRQATYNQTTGIYSNSCLSFFGCPVNRPYQCPTGNCVINQFDCLAYSNQFCNGGFMCKNLACVSDPTLCNIDISSLQIQQIEVDLNPYEFIKLYFSYNGTQPVAGLTIPYGALPKIQVQVNLYQDTFRKLRITPVPQTRSYLTQVNSDAIKYVSQFYPLINNNSLSTYNSLLTPMVKIELINVNQLLINGTVQFLLDLPSSMDLLSDVCLAQVTAQGQFICVSRNITSIDQNWISLPFSQSGFYGIIFCPDMSLKTSIPSNPTPTPNPKPDPNSPIKNSTTPVNTDNCSSKFQAWCKYSKYKWYIIGGGIGILTVLILIIVCCCCWKKKIPDEDQSVYSAQKNSKVEENLLNEAQVQERIEEEKQQILRLVQEDFKEKLKKKDIKIAELENNIITLSQTSPMSRITIQRRPEFHEEVRLVEDKIKQHYSSEVQRIAASLQKEAELTGKTPPRQFIRASKKLSLKDYSSGDESKDKQMPSDNQLSEQWNNLVHEYKPSKDLLSQTSRPLLLSTTENQSSKSNKGKKEKVNNFKGFDADRSGFSTQATGIKKSKKL